MMHSHLRLDKILSVVQRFNYAKKVFVEQINLVTPNVRFTICVDHHKE